jgi:hypothetical protein
VNPEMEGNMLFFSRINFKKAGRIRLVYEMGVIGCKDDET